MNPIQSLSFHLGERIDEARPTIRVDKVITSMHRQSDSIQRPRRGSTKGDTHHDRIAVRHDGAAHAFFLIVPVRNIYGVVSGQAKVQFHTKYPSPLTMSAFLVRVFTVLKPQLRVFNKFESGVVKGFADNMEDYWGNILDYSNRLWDMTEDYGELIEGLSTTFDSLQANKTNEIMKILTLISSIVLPLTFLTGVYGMNVLLPLQDDNKAFWIIVVVMILLIGAMLLFFRRKKWM